MSAAKPQVQKSVEPQRAIRNRNVGQPLEVQDDDGQDKSGPGPPPRAKAAAPASTHTSDDASLLPSELTNAAREARASRKRALIGLLVLIIAAAGALAAGLAVKQAVFWGASASVFAAASMALVAYGAEKLGVFGQTAELLSRRAASDDATKSRSSTRGRDDPQDETKLQRQVAGDIAWDILCLPQGHTGAVFYELETVPRDQLLAALGALNRAAVLGDGSAGVFGAKIASHLHGKDCEQVRDLLLQASACGSTVAAYTLGLRQGDVPPREQRAALLAWARMGVGAAAFMVGTIDTPGSRFHLTELPQETETEARMYIQDGRPVPVQSGTSSK